MASNKKLGSDFEGRFSQELFKMGFWVHLLTQNSAGQPADIIASRNGKAALIDCKVCEKGYLRLDRVEDKVENGLNQAGNDVKGAVNDARSRMNTMIADGKGD